MAPQVNYCNLNAAVTSIKTLQPLPWLDPPTLDHCAPTPIAPEPGTCQPGTGPMPWGLWCQMVQTSQSTGPSPPHHVSAASIAPACVILSVGAAWGLLPFGDVTDILHSPECECVVFTNKRIFKFYKTPVHHTRSDSGKVGKPWAWGGAVKLTGRRTWPKSGSWTSKKVKVGGDS